MAQLGGTFDAEAIPPREGGNFEVMRRGWVNAHAIESDYVDTKSLQPDGKPKGKRATFTFEILDGEYKGRKAWAGLNIVNVSAQAQAIGQRELADLALAVGVPRIDDTKQAEFIPIQIKLGIDKDDKDKNTVDGYRKYGGERLAPSGQANAPAPAQQQAQPQTAAKSGSPWPSRAA